jgi:hypothetical protein
MTRAVELAQVASTGVSEAFKNRIINGDMRIDQRNNGASVTVDSTKYIVDRWRGETGGSTGGGVFTGQQSTVAPVGFTNSLLCTVTTTDTSLGTGDLSEIAQIIEGFNVADLGWGTANAKTVTLSFWVRSSVTGSYSIGFQNNGNNRSYVAVYTINAANTWEQKTITVIGDTSGTWLTNNGIGFQIRWCFATGSNRVASTADTWEGANRIAISSTSNPLMGTNGATFYITGVQLEVGTVASSFEYRPYGTELQLCQRYFYRLNRTTGGDNTVATGANSASHNLFVIKMPTELRAKPTISKTGTAFTVYTAGVNTVNPTFASSTAGTQHSRIIFTLTGTSGNSCWMDLDNDNTYFDFSSEL